MDANKMLFFFNFMSFIFISEKKVHTSSICKPFLFPKSNDPPKVITPRK